MRTCYRKRPERFYAARSAVVPVRYGLFSVSRNLSELLPRDRPLRAEIIASVTQNLFKEDRIPGTDHPAEVVAKTLLRVSEFKVSPTEGIEIKTK